MLKSFGCQRALFFFFILLLEDAGCGRLEAGAASSQRGMSREGKVGEMQPLTVTVGLPAPLEWEVPHLFTKN